MPLRGCGIRDFKRELKGDSKDSKDEIEKKEDFK